MLRGNRFRIYPKKDQKIILEKHFGSSRFIFNKFLNIRQTLHDKFKASISKIDLDNHLVLFKELYPWLKEVNSQSLQQVNKDLDNAFQRFFKGLGKYPNKKSYPLQIEWKALTFHSMSFLSLINFARDSILNLLLTLSNM